MEFTTVKPSWFSGHSGETDMGSSVWTSPHFGKNLTGLASLLTSATGLAIALITARRDSKDDD